MSVSVLMLMSGDGSEERGLFAETLLLSSSVKTHDVFIPAALHFYKDFTINFPINKLFHDIFNISNVIDVASFPLKEICPKKFNLISIN